MKKDIPVLTVEDIGIAAVPSADPNFWDIYIINLMEETIKNVMITASGYGELDGSPRQSSTMRYYIEEIESLDLKFLEPLSTAIFDLTNEYWVSFSLNGQLYDKRYMFVPGVLHPMNFIRIPFLEQQGVMVR